MIPRTETALHNHSWQWYLRHAIRNTDDLAKALRIDIDPVPTAFPLFVPEPYLSRIERGNPDDPLLLQVLPRHAENQVVEGYVNDPLQEVGQLKGSGIIHKYHGRILIVTTGACAINCRYCFRRHFPYSEAQLGHRDWQNVLSYIREDPAIREVILSGGDPLLMSDKQLSDFVNMLGELKQITHLRIHTRMPIVIPQRVNETMLDWISGTKLKVVVVIHANHEQELDDQVHRTVQKLLSAGVSVLNQSVLLKNVNDNCEALCNLSWRLSSIGALPYYLHRLDKVAGAAHFDITATRAQELITQMKNRMPGYLVPRLVSEIPGSESKQELIA